MCEPKNRLLHMECSGEIITMFVTEQECIRANSDSSFAQYLFDRHTGRDIASIPDTYEGNCETSINNENETEDYRDAENEGNVGLRVVQENNSASIDAFWSEAETLLFISLYDNHKEDFKHAKKRKHVWTLIAEEMAAHKYYREVDKLERKWTNLMRVYRAIKDNKGPRKTGRGAQNYKYFEKLEEIVGDKPSNNPSSSSILEMGVNSDVLPACDSATLSKLDENSDTVNSPFSVSVDSETENICPTPKKRKENKAISITKQKMQQREQQHTELVELEKRRLAVEEKKLELLEKYLEKLSEKSN